MEGMDVDDGESLLDIEVSSSPRQSGSINIDGSPVARRAQRIDSCREAIASTSSVALPTEDSNRVTCSCKNTCSRKKTAKSTGCPCRNAAQACSSSCKCGTKKSACKNRTTVVVVNRNPSAFARHEEQVTNAEREIQEFINSLAMIEKDQILLRLLSQGRGSLDYAKNILEDVNSSHPPAPEPDANTPEWCICSVCRPMPLEIENVCCRKRTCVTSYTMFENICLDREVLTLTIRARFDIRAEEPDYSSNSYRKAAYRQYCLWKYGKLGKGNRRVLPSCIVLAVRRYFPAPDGVYMGYKRF